MDREEIKRKYHLVESDTYKEIRAEALNYIVEVSGSPVPAERVQGMLLLIREIDGWRDAFERELEKARKER